MSDALARTLAAGETIEVDGREYHLSPLDMGLLQEVQRCAVMAYRREYIETYAESVKYLPDGQAVLARKIDEAARWDVTNLPPKVGHDTQAVPVTDAVRDLVNSIIPDLEEPIGDAGIRGLLMKLLDSGEVTLDQVEKASGVRPIRGRVSYDTWWITSTYEGIITTVWAGLKPRHPEITREQVSRWPMHKLTQWAQRVEALTAPAVGNT